MTPEEYLADLEEQIEEVNSEIRASYRCQKCLVELRVRRFELIKELENAIRNAGTNDTEPTV